jgi:transglutaminase-like putative cysteine protease
MKALRSVVGPYLALGLLGILGFVAVARGSATLGGSVSYYDANWYQVGAWYKPCSGQASHWGVVGVNAEIDDWYSCEGDPGPGGCTPTIVNCGVGCTSSSTSLVCNL